jgi:hypothetical protein
MSVSIQMIVTASTVQEMEEIAKTVNACIDEIAKIAPHIQVDTSQAQVNQDNSISESITLRL